MLIINALLVIILIFICLYFY